MIERRSPVPVGYVGAHRLVEGETPAQFRAANVIKRNKVTKGLQP